MDVVLVGLPGSGKTVVGRRLANRHGASLVDLDERIETAAGRTHLGGLRRGRRGGVPGARAGGHRRPRPGRPGARDPAGDLDRRRRRRRPAQSVGALSRTDDGLARWPARGPRPAPPPLPERPAAGHRSRPDRDAARPGRAARAVLRRHRHPPVGRRRGPWRGRRGRGPAPRGRIGPTGTTLLRTSTPIGRFVLGDGIAADALACRAGRAAGAAGDPGQRAGRLGGRRGAAGERSARARPRGRARPASRRARRPSGSRSSRARPASWPRLRVERSEPLVAIGGGALGDTAGFLAAVYLRGVPIIHVPTTLVAQIDSSIGGKTGVDLPEGKNLVGAFHQPAAVIIDIAMLRTLPERQMRAALGEAVKMAALGDERLFELLETDGPAIARGDEAVFTSGRPRRARRAGGLGQGRGGPRRRARARRLGRPDRPQPRALARARVRGGRRLRRPAPRRGRRLRAAGGDAGSGSRRGHAAGAGRRGSAGCSTPSGWRPSRSPTRSPRSWTTSPPTRSTPRAGSAGSCRPPTASSSATTSTRRSSSGPPPACWPTPSGSPR